MAIFNSYVSLPKGINSSKRFFWALYFVSMHKAVQTQRIQHYAVWTLTRYFGVYFKVATFKKPTGLTLVDGSSCSTSQTKKKAYLFLAFSIYWSFRDGTYMKLWQMCETNINCLISKLGMSSGSQRCPPLTIRQEQAMACTPYSHL